MNYLSIKRFIIVYIRLLIIIFILVIFVDKPIIFTISMFISVATYRLEIDKFKNNNNTNDDNNYNSDSN